jgi:hypothetical protein
MRTATVQAARPVTLERLRGAGNGTAQPPPVSPGLSASAGSANRWFQTASAPGARPSADGRIQLVGVDTLGNFWQSFQIGGQREHLHIVDPR